MPDYNNEQTSPGSREQQRRRSWWEGAKHFVLKYCGMYDIGDVGGNSNIHITNININPMHVGQIPVPRTPRVVQREGNGLSGNYQMSYVQLMCHLISERQQSDYNQMPVVHERSGEEAPQINPSQGKLTVLRSASVTNMAQCHKK